MLISVNLVLGAVLLFLFTGSYSNECVVLSLLAFLISVAVTLISHACYFSDQVEDLERLNENREDWKIYGCRAKEYAGLLREALMERYPEHERDIFKLITNSNASTVFQVYPQLKADKTIESYAKKMIDIQEGIYNNELNRNSLIRSIKVRSRVGRLWLLPRFLPDKVDQW